MTATGQPATVRSDPRPAGGLRLIGFRDGAVTVVGGLDADHQVVPIADVESFWADPYSAMAQLRLAAGRRPVGGLELVAPVRPAARVICIGLNYRDHVVEGPFEVPDHPAVFARWTASLNVSGGSVVVPAGESGLDWEGELVAVVGVPLHDVDEQEALAGVFGYAAFNDLTARRAQRRTSQWTLGKNVDGSGILGPITPAAELGDPADGWSIRTRVNDAVMQDASTADLIFPVGAILASISTVFELRPGDLIATGTPNGVGYARTPPIFLQPGDRVSVEIEHLDAAHARVLAPPTTKGPR